MTFYKTYILVILLSFLFALNTSAGSALRLTKQQWKEISKGADYTETYHEMAKSNIKPLDYDLKNFKYVFYFLIIGLVLFVIIKIIFNFNKNPIINETKISIDSIQEIEEKLHEIDLDKLYKEALDAKNYRIALRINFLIIIKMLSQNEKIIWAKEKTNWEYYSELKEEKLSVGFKAIIISFESVWYGDLHQTETQFSQVIPIYENFKKQIAPK